MPQTLLALLGLSLASMMAFNQQRSTVHSYGTMIENEIEVAASGAIMHAMEMVGTLAFDEETTPDAIWNKGNTHIPDDPDELSETAQFGTSDRGSNGCNLMRPWETPLCDDIDDLDGLQDERVGLDLITGDSLYFDLSIDVDYVEHGDVDQVVNDRTLHKRVTIRAKSPHFITAPDRTIELVRVFSYDDDKAEYEHDQVYPSVGT